MKNESSPGKPLPGNEADGDADNDASIELLLREVGVRQELPPHVTQEVRRAVHAEWQATVRERKRRIRAMGFGVAASAVLAMAAVSFFYNPRAVSDAPLLVRAQPERVGTLANVQAPSSHALVQLSSDGGKTWRDIAKGDIVHTGDVVRTDAMTRIALRMSDGLSMRVDSESLIQFNALHRVELTSGRVYIDAEPNKHELLSVVTKFGVLDHLGTQYQAQVAGDRLSLSVREGRVVLSRARGRVDANAGEVVEFDEDHELARHAVSAQDDSWQWAVAAAPTFDIDKQSLASFLTWVERETRRQVQYASPEVQAQAEQLQLRGSISTLNPDQALRAVLATTPFQYTARPDAIVIAQ